MKKLLIAALFALPLMAHAVPPDEITEAQLEKVIAQDQACRIVMTTRLWAVKLYFANKKEAEEAIERMKGQSFGKYRSDNFYSPDCDINVGERTE